MQIEEHNNFVNLFDTYGKLLSKKQFEVADKFFNLDLSESELAELLGETRQSIHDAIQKAKKQLLEFESRCEVIAKREILTQKLLTIKKLASNEKLDSIERVIDELLEEL